MAQRIGRVVGESRIEAVELERRRSFQFELRGRAEVSFEFGEPVVNRILGWTPPVRTGSTPGGAYKCAHEEKSDAVGPTELQTVTDDLFEKAHGSAEDDR